MAVLAAAASPVCAQQTSPDTASEADAPTQVTVTARAGDPKNSTASKTIVGRDTLDAHGDAKLGDALKRIPGVSVDHDGGIGLRGLGSGYTQILLNGEPAPPDFSITSLPPDSIERVEITWTPTADMRGDAIAGTINIVLRKSVHRRETDARFGISQGMGRPGAVLSATFSDRKDHLSYVIDASLTHNDDINTDTQTADTLDGLGRPVDITDTYERYRFRVDTFTLDAQPDPDRRPRRQHLAAGAVQYGAARTSFRGQTTDAPLGASLPYADNPQYIIYDNRMARADLDHSRKLTEAVSLKLKASASDFHRGGFDPSDGPRCRRAT